MIHTKQHRVAILTILFACVALFIIVVLPQSAMAQGAGQVGPRLADGSFTQVTPDKGVSPTTMVGTFIGNTLLWISSSVTWLGGAIMSVSFERLVIGMGDQTMLGGPIGLAIDDMWRIIRDICNLAFIFGFIYAGITIIVKGNDMMTKRMLSQIIIGALLINFSLFFVKLIADVGNYIAVEIWNVLAGGTGNIAVKVTDLMGLSTLWDFNRIQVGDFSNVTTGGNFAFYFMAAIFLIVAGFVFAAGGILIIIRFVMLIFYMIFSPILFAATVFPSTADTASAMWKKVINYSLFAPAYLLLVLASIRIGEIFSANVRGPQAFSTSFSSGTEVSAYGVFLNFCVIILFLILSLHIANKFGIAGGERVMSFGNSMRKKIQGGVTSYVGRNVVGRGAKSAGEKYAKTYARVGNSVSNSKVSKWMDKSAVGRATKVVAAKGGKAALFAGTLGVAGGVINDRNIRETLDAGAKAKFGGAYSRSDDAEYEKARKREFARVKSDDTLSNAVSSGAVDSNKKPHAYNSADPEYLALVRAVRDASNEQLLELLKDLKAGTPEYNAVVANLSHSQYEKFMDEKEENFDMQQKGDLAKARETSIQNQLGLDPNDPSKNAGLSKATQQQLETLGVEFLKKNAQNLSAAQLDDLKKSKNLIEQEVKAINDLRDQHFTGIVQMAAGSARSTAIQNEITQRRPKDAAKLPEKILTDPDATLHITPDILQAMIDEKVDRKVQQQVYENLSSNINNPSLSREMKAYLRSPMIQNRFGAPQGTAQTSGQREQSRTINPGGQIDTSGLSLADDQ